MYLIFFVIIKIGLSHHVGNVVEATREREKMFHISCLHHISFNILSATTLSLSRF